MRYSLYLLFACLFLTSCNDGVDDAEIVDYTKQKIRMTVYHYGTWTGSDATDGERSDLDQQTDTIKLELDRTIGIQYEISSSPNTDKSITLHHYWVKPHQWYDEDIEDSTDRVFETSYPSYTHYGFIQYDITEADLHQKGRWQLLVYYGNHLLYRKNYFLT